MVILLFTCLLTHLVGWLATCFQSLHERLHINPCHDLLCLLPPLKLLVSPKDLPSVTIHLLHFYAPQMSKHECLSNPISHYLPVEVPWGRGDGEAPILAGCLRAPGLTLQPGTCPVLKKKHYQDLFFAHCHNLEIFSGNRIKLEVGEVRRRDIVRGDVGGWGGQLCALCMGGNIGVSSGALALDKGKGRTSGDGWDASCSLSSQSQMIFVFS